MKYRALVTVLGLLALTGCKIEIPATAGGIVQSESGTYFCLPGQACVIDVSTTDFDETFVAEPADGFEFRGWAKGLCGGSEKPCRLRTVGLDENPDLMAVLRSDRSFRLEPVFEYVGDGSGQRAFLVNDDDSGMSNMVLHPEGASLTVSKGDNGDRWGEMRFVDGESLLIRYDADGMPLELFHNDTLIVFRAFSEEEVTLGIFLEDDTVYEMALPVDDALGQLIVNRTGAASTAVSTTISETISTTNSTTISKTPATARSVAGAGQTTGTASADDAETTSTATDNLIKAAEATAIAAEVVGSRSLKPLFDDLTATQKKKIQNEIKRELINRPQSSTSSRLQTSIMVHGAQCAVTVGTGGAVSLLLDASACKELTRGAFQLTQQWAIGKKSRLGLDRLEDAGVAIKPEDFLLEVSEKLTSLDEAIKSYRPEITFLSPGVRGTYVDRDPRVIVKVRDRLNILTIDELILYLDGKIATNHIFGVATGPARLSPRPTSGEPEPLEVDNYFFLKGLKPGEHRLLARAVIRGSQRRYDQIRDVSVRFTVCENGVNKEGTACLGQCIYTPGEPGPGDGDNAWCTDELGRTYYQEFECCDGNDNVYIDYYDLDSGKDGDTYLRDIGRTYFSVPNRPDFVAKMTPVFKDRRTYYGNGQQRAYIQYSRQTVNGRLNWGKLVYSYRNDGTLQRSRSWDCSSKADFGNYYSSRMFDETGAPIDGSGSTSTPSKSVCSGIQREMAELRPLRAEDTILFKCRQGAETCPADIR